MSELMSDAINLMLVGMGFVFVFLIVLVFVTSTMSKLVSHFAPEVPDSFIVHPTPNLDNVAADDLQLVAVISAAIAKYRSQHKSE